MDGLTVIGRSWLRRPDDGWPRLRRRQKQPVPPDPPPDCPNCAALTRALESIEREHSVWAGAADAVHSGLQQERDAARRALEDLRAEMNTDPGGYWQRRATHWERLYHQQYETSRLLDERLAAAEGRPRFVALPPEARRAVDARAPLSEPKEVPPDARS